MQIDVSQLAQALLDDAAFFFDHGFCPAVQAMMTRGDDLEIDAFGHAFAAPFCASAAGQKIILAA